MSERKPTDEEIKEVLECCSKSDCGNCNRDWSYVAQWDCMRHIERLALDLINRQQAEIESLQRQLHNSKLHEKECYEARRVLLMEKDHDTKMTKAEAIKEFAERIKVKILSMVWSPDVYSTADYGACIDGVVKEMVGDAE